MTENEIGLLTEGIPVTKCVDGQERGNRIFLVDFDNSSYNFLIPKFKGNFIPILFPLICPRSNYIDRIMLPLITEVVTQVNKN